MRSDLLNTVLEDDNTELGGVAYQGETVKEFMLEVGLDLETTTLAELNDSLKALGIKPIKTYHAHRMSPYERTKAMVYATGNKWAIENFEATH